MYRFHPSVQWNRGYPDRQQILSQVRQLWERYGLKERTRFNTKIDRVYQDDQGRWIVNDPSLGRFGGVIAAVGTCGAPKMPKIPGMDNFNGPIYHSSELTGYVAQSTILYCRLLTSLQKRRQG
jgi:cation diffusion facilitator CzcD-associated flavoprotein CzcO